MTGHIFIEGDIGTKVTLDSVREDISLYPNAQNWEVHINSGGGEVFTGQAIGYVIQNLGKPTVAKIESLCASIASWIALSCDRVIMAPAGSFMIHLPTGNINGTADDLRRGATQLDRMESELIAKYMPRVSRKGVTREEVAQMMDVETPMSPQEALNKGFIDEIQAVMKAAARIDIKNMEKTISKEQAGFLEEFGKKIDNFFARLGKATFKNVTVTLADGTEINSSADDPNTLEGSVLTDANGQPLKPGTYQTMDGYALAVSEGGKCETMSPIEEEQTNDMDKDKEIASLKKQLEDATKVQQAQTEEVKVAAKQLGEFKNVMDEFKTMKAEYEKLRNATFGDDTVKNDAADKTIKKAEAYDPQLIAMYQGYNADQYATKKQA